MNLGLYNEPTNSSSVNYKGLYRQNSIVDLMESDNYKLKSAIDWYFSISREGMYIEYSKKNMECLLEVYSALRDQKWMGEIIMFTDHCGASVPSDFLLLGYDICADSKYYSPIGDGFLRNYDKNTPFFVEMSISEFERYKNNINDAGLFNDYAIALEFSTYCNTVNSKHEHAVESENNWRPFAIFGQAG